MRCKEDVTLAVAGLTVQHVFCGEVCAGCLSSLGQTPSPAELCVPRGLAVQATAPAEAAGSAGAVPVSLFVAWPWFRSRDPQQVRRDVGSRAGQGQRQPVPGQRPLSGRAPSPSFPPPRAVPRGSWGGSAAPRPDSCGVPADPPRLRSGVGALLSVLPCGFLQRRAPSGAVARWERVAGSLGVSFLPLLQALGTRAGSSAPWCEGGTR